LPWVDKRVELAETVAEEGQEVKAVRPLRSRVMSQSKTTLHEWCARRPPRLAASGGL